MGKRSELITHLGDKSPKWIYREQTAMNDVLPFITTTHRYSRNSKP